MDYAKVTAVQAPTLVTRRATFDVDVYSENLGSTDNAVIYRVERQPKDLEFHGAGFETPDGLSPCDGHWCEGGSATVLTISKSRYRFVWTGAKGAQFSLEFCAFSFTNPVEPAPYGGSCVTKRVTVAP